MSVISDQIRREVVACLAAADRELTPELFARFGPDLEEKNMISDIDEIRNIEENERPDYIITRLKSLIAGDEFVGLAEIHPAWLVEVLSKESPRIIGIILRYLPSKQVRYIIENLPKRIKHKLPDLIDSFSVPSEILSVIKERFERQFISLKGIKQIDEFTFETIALLKSSDLMTLFRDLGIQEMAMALKGVNRRSLNILYNRLSIDEARKLQQRIHSLNDVPASVLKEAKYTLLEINLSEAEPKDLLLDLGLKSFAKSMSASDFKMFPLLKQKLKPRLGYTLKRYIDEHMNSSAQENVNQRKQIVMERLEKLSKAGKIDESLKHYFSAREETTVMPAPGIIPEQVSDKQYKEDML